MINWILEVEGVDEVACTVDDMEVSGEGKGEMRIGY